MEKTVSKQKILWAVDAFEESNEVFNHSAQFLRQIATALPAEIEPVYILNPNQLNLAMELTPPFTERYAPAAKRALEQRLKNLGIPDLRPARVLVHSRLSLRGAADTLFAYAKEENASSIVVGSHGRKGFERFLVGSFAEELLLHSSVPVTVIGANSAIGSEPVKEILFPTDFGDGAYDAFTGVLDFAERLKARVTVLHSIPRAIEPVLQSGVYLLSGGWVSFPEFQNLELTKQRHLAEAWKAKAARRDVSLTWVMDTNCTSITQSILSHASVGQAGIIAMAAQSKRLSSALIGSVTRQIVRSASCPVWVLRPKPELG